MVQFGHVTPRNSTPTRITWPTVWKWTSHARALGEVAKSPFPLKAVVFKSRYRVLTRFPYTWTPFCTLAWREDREGVEHDDLAAPVEPDGVLVHVQNAVL